MQANCASHTLVDVYVGLNDEYVNYISLRDPKVFVFHKKTIKA